jgi:hypothetical protein
VDGVKKESGFGSIGSRQKKIMSIIPGVFSTRNLLDMKIPKSQDFFDINLLVNEDAREGQDKLCRAEKVRKKEKLVKNPDITCMLWISIGTSYPIILQ